MRFNYVRSGLLESVRAFRPQRIPPALRPPLCALLTVLVVALASGALERYRVDRAFAIEQFAQTRVERSRALLAQTQVARVRVDALLALDKRLRTVRLSGSILALRLTDIAAHVPRRAWLSSISRTDGGIALTGEAEGLPVLGDTMTGLMSSTSLRAPSLIRATAEAGGLVSFEIRLQEVPQ